MKVSRRAYGGIVRIDDEVGLPWVYLKYYGTLSEYILQRTLCSWTRPCKSVLSPAWKPLFRPRGRGASPAGRPYRAQSLPRSKSRISSTFSLTMDRTFIRQLCLPWSVVLYAIVQFYSCNLVISVVGVSVRRVVWYISNVVTRSIRKRYAA